LARTFLLQFLTRLYALSRINEKGTRSPLCVQFTPVVVEIKAWTRVPIRFILCRNPFVSLGRSSFPKRTRKLLGPEFKILRTRSGTRQGAPRLRGTLTKRLVQHLIQHPALLSEEANGADGLDSASFSLTSRVLYFFKRPLAGERKSRRQRWRKRREREGEREDLSASMR